MKSAIARSLSRTGTSLRSASEIASSSRLQRSVKSVSSTSSLERK